MSSAVLQKVNHGPGAFTLTDQGHRRVPAGEGGRADRKSGGGSSAAREGANDLFSVSNANILIALGEGPIEGPEEDQFAKALLINGVPLMSPSGDLNYQGFTIDWRNGTPDQTYIPDARAGELERGVGRKVFNGIPVVESVLDADVDAVVVRVRFPALREIRDDGTYGASVLYRIDVAPNDGNYVTRYQDTLSGKTTSPYDRSHRIDLQGDGPWTVRVVRVTEDSDSERLANEIFFQAITEVKYTQQRFPDTALIKVAIDARQFNSTPTVLLRTKGLRVLVPNNYDTDNGTYNGFFDGTLRESWTNNPVWVLYDLLTDTRYGARLNHSRIDLASFYAAAVYCDERVSTNGGAEERRFTFNGTIETRGQAFKICEAVAASFHGLICWDGTKVRLVVDRLKSPVRKYTRKNTLAKFNQSGVLTEPAFSYSDVSLTSIHTVANVSYRDPDDGYQLRTIQYKDQAAIDRYGYRPIDITAFGCTSKAQAYRYGKWRILTDLLQLTTLRIRVAREGMLVGLGDIVHVFDRNVSGAQHDGMIVEADANSITLDEPIFIDAGLGEYNLLTVGGDGQSQYSTLDLSNSTQSSASTYSVLRVVDPFETEPIPDTTWGIVGPTVVPQQFEVVRIGENDDHSYSIECVQYEPGKFASIDEGVDTTLLATVGIENPYSLPQPPTFLQVEESLYQTTRSSGIKVRADVSWSHENSPNNRAASFKIDLRRAGEPTWVFQGYTEGRSFPLLDIAPNDYEVRVTPISPLGFEGAGAETAAIIYGLTDPPGDIINLRAEYFNGSIRLQWTQPPELDVQINGTISVYHTPLIDSSATQVNAQLVDVLGGDRSELVRPPISGTYYVGVADSSGNPSPGYASVVFDAQEVLSRNVIVELNEDPDFTGQKINVVLDPLLNAIRIDDLSLGGGTYEVTDPIDMGGVSIATITSTSIIFATNVSEVFDSAPGLFDNRSGLFDGGGEGIASGRVEFAYSLDGNTYTDWVLPSGQPQRFRYLKVRLVMSTADPNYNVICTKLGIEIDVDDVLIDDLVSSSAAGASPILFESSFFIVPIVVGNIVNPDSGDYFRIENRTAEGFDLTIFNSAGNPIEKDFLYIAKGY